MHNFNNDTCWDSTHMIQDSLENFHLWDMICYDFVNTDDCYIDNERILIYRCRNPSKNKFVIVKKKDDNEPIFNRVTKPWGYYIDHYRSEKTVLKTIVVNPHSRLSLQSHKGRKERWTILEGEAIVEYEDLLHKTMNLSRKKVADSIHNNIGQKHRLINDTNKPLVVAEVQYGICDEDDIERFEDDYGR